MAASKALRPAAHRLSLAHRRRSGLGQRVSRHTRPSRNLTASGHLTDGRRDDDAVNDLYSFDPTVQVRLEEFTDIVGRNFRQPKEGLGFDGSPTAHMWRTMMFPDNPL